jgi:hypothetical protein
MSPFNININNNSNNNNNNSSKFNLVLCELFNRNIHGSSSSTIEEIDGHYLLISKFDGKTNRLLETETDYNSETDYDSDESELSTINDFVEFYNEYYNDGELEPHNILRNYQNIIARLDYIKPEIAECIELESQYSVTIIKTIWIKLIQRKWKKIYAERKNVIRQRAQFASLRTRELTGKWPQHCLYLPSIRGILRDLKP